MAIPVAQWFDLIDVYTASVAWIVTLIDLISMLTYLNHDDELSIQATNVYELVRQRKSDNSDDIRHLNIDIASDGEDDRRSEFMSSSDEYSPGGTQKSAE